MAVFTPRKTSQLLATGILLILAAICTFVVIFLTYGGKLELTPNLLDNKGELWSAIPVLLTGCLGIITSKCQKNWLVTCYLLGCLASFVLGILASIQAGIMVWELRNACGEGDSACRNSTVASLLSSVVLVGSLLVCMAVWGSVVACQVKWGPSKRTKFLIASGQYNKGVEATVGFAENTGYIGDSTPQLERSHPRQPVITISSPGQSTPGKPSKDDAAYSPGATSPTGDFSPNGERTMEVTIHPNNTAGHPVEPTASAKTQNPDQERLEESTRF